MSFKSKLMEFKKNKKEEKQEDEYLLKRQVFISQQLKAFKAYQLLGKLSIENNSVDYINLYEENKELFVNCNIDRFKNAFFANIKEEIDSLFDDKMNVINMSIKMNDYGNQSLNLLKRKDKYEVFLFVVSHEALGGYDTEKYGIEFFDNFSDAEEAFYLRLSSNKPHNPSELNKIKKNTENKGVFTL